MEAMILAAGGGTRLLPLTETLPKALVEVGGRPLLARVLDRLQEAGVSRVVVNVHHHEDQLRAYLRDRAPKGVEVAVSPEPGGPYETGGGLFAAAPLFRENRPFLLHNVDVLSDIPLAGLLEGHGRAADLHGHGLVATVATQDRPARRRLLFDDRGLMGWENRGSDRAAEGREVAREPLGEVRALAFTGIHVVEPRIFGLSDRAGVFSIITLYLELAAQGFVVSPLDVSQYRWLDVGTHGRRAEAERWVEEG